MSLSHHTTASLPQYQDVCGTLNESALKYREFTVSCFPNMQRALWVGWFSWLASVTTTAVITGINPELVNEGTTTITAHCAPACSQALPVKPQGHGYWSVSEVSWHPNLELWRWQSSGPSSLMVVSCAKFCGDRMAMNTVRVRTIFFSKFQLGQKYLL